MTAAVPALLFVWAGAVLQEGAALSVCNAQGASGAAAFSTHSSNELSILFCMLAGVVELLPTLLDFRPEAYGTPAFTDLLPEGVTPVQPPVCIRGTVVKGFGRGSKVRLGCDLSATGLVLSSYVSPCRSMAQGRWPCLEIESGLRQILRRKGGGLKVRRGERKR